MILVIMRLMMRKNNRGVANTQGGGPSKWIVATRLQLHTFDLKFTFLSFGEDEEILWLKIIIMTVKT